MNPQSTLSFPAESPGATEEAKMRQTRNLTKTRFLMLAGVVLSVAEVEVRGAGSEVDMRGVAMG